MHVLLLFLIGVTAYATSRISNRFPRFQAANFGQMMDGRQLNGSVIKEIEESESSCRLECVNEERCKSYNFGSKKNKPGFKKTMNSSLASGLNIAVYSYSEFISLVIE